MHDIYQFFAYVAYGRGLVLHRWGDKIPSRRGNFGGFLPMDNAFCSIAFGTHTKTSKPIEIPFGMMNDSGGH